MTDKPKNGSIEYRYIERNAPKVNEGILSGRAAPFNTVTMIGKKPWGFREQISPGAFKKSINDGDVVLLDQHDTAKPISRQSAGTLKLNESKGGLDWEAVPANTSYARDALENAKAGNYGGCSFGFEVIRDSWHYNKDDDVDERTLHEVRLHEISTVTFPAYTEGTTVSARDQVEAAKEARNRYYMREYLDLYVVNGVDEEDEQRGGNAPGNGKKPYGNVTYADPGYQSDGKKRYPIDTKQHAKAAWSYINKASNASAYTSKQLASIKAKIQSALKKFGVKVSGNKNSEELDTEAREVVQSASVATAEVIDNLTDRAVRDQKIIEVCLDTNIPDSLRGAHVLALMAGSKLPDIEGLRKIAKRLNKVGNSVQTDADSDDPICDHCHGSGKMDDGVADCAGCGGVGRVAGPGSTSNPGDGKQGGTPGKSQGDDKGTHKDSSNGLGLGGPAGPSDQSNANGDGHSGDGDTVPVPTKGPQLLGTGKGTGVDNPANLKLAKYSKDDPDEETREDEGQPDASTDPDEDDKSRWLKAKARQRRLQFESNE